MKNRNKFGRVYEPGREVIDDLKRIIVDLLIKGGADGASLKMPKRTIRHSVARQVGISVNCITSIWRRYASVGTVCRRSLHGGRPKIVQQEDVDLFAWLKTIESTMSLKFLKDSVFNIQILERVLLCRLFKNDQ